jgi:hypothetical protein
MIVFNKMNVEKLFMQEEKEIKFEIDLNALTKLQLYLTGNTLKGVELFRIGPIEAKRFGFMVDFGELINSAIETNYKVFVFKEGGYLKRGNWYLKLINKNRD